MLLPSLLVAAVCLADPPKTTASDVKKDAAQTVDASKRYANEKKEEFQARIEEKMKSLRAEVVTLKDQAKAGAKEQADATLKDIDAKQKQADARLGELTKAGGKAWTSLKGGVEKAVDDLDTGIQKAKAK